MKTLPKTHYWYPPEENRADKNNQAIRDMVRITHSACLYAAYNVEPEFDAMVYHCAQVNAEHPRIPAVMGLHYSPWVKLDSPTDRGDSYMKERGKLRASMEKSRDLVDYYGTVYDCEVGSTIILECEKFKTPRQDQAYLDGMRELFDEATLMAEELFPTSRVVWYGWGLAQYWNSNTTHPRDNWVLARAQVLSCSLYSVPEVQRSLDLLKATIELAGDKPVVPWVGLGAGYKRREDGQDFLMDWPYDPQAAWEIGRAINRMPEVDSVVFWPRMDYSKSPAWRRHFGAYVRGATGRGVGA